MVSFKYISKAFKKRKVVDGVSFSVESGQVVGLLGPNGAGKTTSFYMVVGIVQPDRGVIELDGDQHMDNQIYDTKRTEWLMAHRFNLLRFWNHDVFQQTSSVLEVIMTALL